MKPEIDYVLMIKDFILISTEHGYIPMIKWARSSARSSYSRSRQTYHWGTIHQLLESNLLDIDETERWEVEKIFYSTMDVHRLISYFVRQQKSATGSICLAGKGKNKISSPEDVKKYLLSAFNKIEDIKTLSIEHRLCYYAPSPVYQHGQPGIEIGMGVDARFYALETQLIDSSSLESVYQHSLTIQPDAKEKPFLIFNIFSSGVNNSISFDRRDWR